MSQRERKLSLLKSGVCVVGLCVNWFVLGKDREGYGEEIIGQINIESRGKLDQRKRHIIQKLGVLLRCVDVYRLFYISKVV